MNILHLLSSIDPSLGGPVECVRQGSAQLVAQGHRVEVLSLDPPDAPYLADFPLPLHVLGPARGYYHYSPRLVPWLREHAQEFDAVIINGLWQYHGFGAWRALRKLQVPYYVYPHGMLDPWFKRAYPRKHLKKWLYWPWAEYRVLRDARAVLFTAEEERRLASQSFWLYRARESVVSLGTQSPPPEHDADGVALRERFLAAYPELRGKRIVLFLGRVHEKKGCDLLIDAFARVAALDPQAHLVIAGPDSAGWVPRLQSQAAARGIGARVSWPGMLRAEMKWGAFYASDVFALPSHQENFGIAVAEALGCAVPALISDKVNIWREIERDGAGLAAPDTVEGCEALLRRWLSMDDAQRVQMRACAKATFNRRFTVESMARDLLRVLQSGEPAQAVMEPEWLGRDA
ncbi:glycosyltransferase [Cupriavidus basilensis]|uniref:glycosyltransferase n=1 Tax=Cupriavidus basilensis TaxID=68895 RepID=UPI00283DC45A|nr:glycosyltransferase [Cupriavidus basilensis]MDR3380617.1 glycosyltransferase [Cupriavidus basilensis]